MSQAYSEPSQTSKMKLFVKIVNGFQPFTIFAKSFISVDWVYASENTRSPKSMGKPLKNRLFQIFAGHAVHQKSFMKMG